MANLLPGARRRRVWAALPAPALERARARLAAITRLDATALETLSTSAVERLATELDELDERADPANAAALLAQLDALRATIAAAPDATGIDPAAPAAGSTGLWIVHRPGRSLQTGEAEIASRGFFDVADRPPLALWVEVLVGEGEGAAPTLGLLCHVPARDAARARAGCEACPSGAVETPAKASPALAEQLAALADPRAPAD